jgi:hypothetical protein
MTSFSRLSATATVGTIFVLCGTAIADDYPTSAAPVTQPIYKCGNGSYSHAACAGGVQMGGARVTRTFDKNTPPPQDRARRVARAVLPPETREKCADLESHIRAGEASLRAKGAPPTEKEEGDMAILRVQYRELRC